ncbi:MAG TPA: glycosyltransferase family 4 protein [Solirubrobacteraceae bacterium]|nr:glycosyltransferase family 4 protein [Solirubrobacteraceae bacterium]
MILFLHNRYRVPGGEERVVAGLRWLVETELGEATEEIVRDSGSLGRSQAAASLLAGGARSREVGEAVRRTRARVLHAHNTGPTFGWRALAAAHASGARVVLHLHNYRLVCAVGVCFTAGQECTRCHGRDTLPGLLHGCRGSRVEGAVYAGALALWQHRLTAQADAVIVPSAFAAARLRELGAPLPWERVHVVPPPVRAFAEGSRAGHGRHALVASRLAPEKGVEVAIDACREIGLALVVAGDGPERPALERHARATGAQVQFLGSVDPAQLKRLRDDAALAIVPSRSAETFGLAAAEAMAAGLPVAATAVGALPELVPAEGLAAGGSAHALAQVARRLAGDEQAGERALAAVRALLAPDRVAESLRRAYAPAAPTAGRG